MDAQDDEDLNGLPNVPYSRYRNLDVNDANNEDGNPANWIGKDLDDQGYGEYSEEDYVEETPACHVIPSDESDQEEEPQEPQPRPRPAKKRKSATQQKRAQPKKQTQKQKHHYQKGQQNENTQQNQSPRKL
ncbi:hypothetical protein LXL04_006925 [Taraxacum kok-saghyz]